MSETEYSYATAHRTPTVYSNDIHTPFEDIGMSNWSNDQIAAFFEGKTAIDIGSGLEGVARRLYQIFGTSKDAPTIVNLNPQFTDWHMQDIYTQDGKRQGRKRYKSLDIEDAIRDVMELADEDFEGYMAQRIAVAGIVQQLEFPDQYFDIQISTWAFPNVLYDCMGDDEYGKAGYREILRTQRKSGIALLAPIRQRERRHVEAQLDALEVPHHREFKDATHEGQVLELRTVSL